MKHVSEAFSPAYLQLYEQMKSDICAGYYTHGQRLPSKRELAADAQVSVITAAHAYELLCDEGYIQPKERSGYFVIYKRSDFISADEMISSAPTAFPAKSVPGGTFPFSVLAKKMRKVISDHGERVLLRSPNSGISELRLAISRYLARSVGISADAGQIIIGSGAEYLYGIIVQLLHGRTFAVEDPSYEKIREVYEAHSVTCEMLPLGTDGIRSEALQTTKASVLHVTPFNSFPSGISADASKRREYLEWAYSHDAYIIEDNYDSELTVSRKFSETLMSTDNRGRVVYLNTFSNTIAPSLRIGYMILPHGLLREYEQRLGFYSCTVPVFDQLVLCELIESGDFERHINRVRRQKRKLLEDTLSQ